MSDETKAPNVDRALEDLGTTIDNKFEEFADALREARAERDTARADLERNAAEVMRLQDELAESMELVEERERVGLKALAELERARGLLRRFVALIPPDRRENCHCATCDASAFLDASPTMEAPTLEDKP